MKLAEAYVEIRGDMAPLRRTLARGGGLFSFVGSAANKLGHAFSRAFGRALHTGWRLIKMGMIGLIGALGTTIYLSGKQEEADIALAESLRTVGKYSAETVRDLKAYAAELQRVTTYGDETIQQTMSMGIALAQLSGERLKEATRMAIGLAEILKIDLQSAMQLVARAAKGQYQLFSRYGIAMADLTTDQEKWNRVLELSNRGFHIAQERAKGLRGSISQLKNVVGDLGEKIGDVLRPALTDTAQRVKEWVRTNDDLIKQRFAEWVEKTQRAMAAIPRWWDEKGREAFFGIIRQLRDFGQASSEFLIALGLKAPTARGRAVEPEAETARIAAERVRLRQEQAEQQIAIREQAERMQQARAAAKAWVVLGAQDLRIKKKLEERAEQERQKLVAMERKFAAAEFEERLRLLDQQMAQAKMWEKPEAARRRGRIAMETVTAMFPEGIGRFMLGMERAGTREVEARKFPGADLAPAIVSLEETLKEGWRIRYKSYERPFQPIGLGTSPEAMLLQEAFRHMARYIKLPGEWRTWGAGLGQRPGGRPSTETEQEQQTKVLQEMNKTLEKIAQKSPVAVFG